MVPAKQGGVAIGVAKDFSLRAMATLGHLLALPLVVLKFGVAAESHSQHTVHRLTNCFST